MSGMTSIYVGTTGLRSSQTGLNTTAHNLANVYTEGYTRQQTRYKDTLYTLNKLGPNNIMQVGLGTDVQETARVRDILLDKAYRLEVGRQAFYTSTSTAVEEYETILGELEGVQFQNSMSDLYQAISEMAKSPSNIVARSELVLKAQAFLDRATAVYDEMKTYQQLLNEKVINTVDRINELGDTIYSLNLQIMDVEKSGVEAANDLRDQRDLALDELATLADVQYNILDDSFVQVKVEGNEFVVRGTVFHMGTAQLETDKDSDFVTPVWPHLADKEVYYLHTDISTAKGNDVGELKGLLLARGEYTADYTDIPTEPVKPQRVDFATDAEYEDAYSTYLDEYSDYMEATDHYNYYIDNSTAMRTQALFDKLINGIVEKINDIMSPNVEQSITINGVTYDNVLVLDEDNASYGIDENGNKIQGVELFSRELTERYIEVTDDDGTVYKVYNNDSNYDILNGAVDGMGNFFGNKSLYTLDNLQMNEQVNVNYGALPFTNQQGEEDLKMGEAMLQAWADPYDNIDPNNMTPLNYNSFYNEIVYELGNMGELYGSISQYQEVLSGSIDDARTEVAGVASEEELTNMIKFQAAYNASSRYINVVSEMLAHIIEKLG